MLVLLVFIAILLLVVAGYLMSSQVNNSKRELNEKIKEAETNTEEPKESDIRTVIVPDNVDVDESSTVSTQDIDAKKYTIDMNEVRGKMEKNVVKEGEVTEEFETNKESLEEIKDMFKNSSASEDDNPIKQPENPIKNILKKDEE